MASDLEILRRVEVAFAQIARPEHFTNYTHCDECSEHDETLREHDRSTLLPEHVNNPGWDPICFCSPQGKAYLLPTLVRFALEPESSYWQQLLFHLEGNGPNNALVSFCSKDQRVAIASFLEHLLNTRTAEIEQYSSADELLRTHGYWSADA